MAKESLGDGQWIAAAVTRYERQLILYALRFLRDQDRAADVVQDTFCRLCRQKKQDVEDHLAEWLYTVCRNRALDVIRKESRMTQLSDLKLAGDAGPDPRPLEEAENREATGLVLDAIDRLPAKQQEVLRLKFQQGMSYRQISRITEQSVSNVGYLIHAAIRALREQMTAGDTEPARS